MHVHTYVVTPSPRPGGLASVSLGHRRLLPRLLQLVVHRVHEHSALVNLRPQRLHVGVNPFQQRPRLRPLLPAPPLQPGRRPRDVDVLDRHVHVGERCRLHGGAGSLGIAHHVRLPFPIQGTQVGQPAEHGVAVATLPGDRVGECAVDVLQVECPQAGEGRQGAQVKVVDALNAVLLQLQHLQALQVLQALHPLETIAYQRELSQRCAPLQALNPVYFIEGEVDFRDVNASVHGCGPDRVDSSGV
mmetsp:Transcript_39494/g.102265  ORF Transcript_39494/g.102265 Transcript_39494/m.102265 type:complete len:245 (+) Transcript_39494:174-908(+)